MLTIGREVLVKHSFAPVQYAEPKLSIQVPSQHMGQRICCNK
uniref:Uncharacterized protein n=1 Tax=Arundo donax TaxID=35708 RepID=A0A0A8YBK5_ARUDO